MQLEISWRLRQLLIGREGAARCSSARCNFDFFSIFIFATWISFFSLNNPPLTSLWLFLFIDAKILICLWRYEYHILMSCYWAKLKSNISSFSYSGFRVIVKLINKIKVIYWKDEFPLTFETVVEKLLAQVLQQEKSSAATSASNSARSWISFIF